MFSAYAAKYSISVRYVISASSPSIAIIFLLLFILALLDCAVTTLDTFPTPEIKSKGSCSTPSL